MAKQTALAVVDGVDMTGRTCVITGAASGLGRESARALATTGAHVVLAGRSRQALDETARWLAAEAPGARVTPMELDLMSLTSIRAAAAQLADLVPVIDVLMNNAGVMFTPLGRTEDGFETQFGTNHLGHFELTRLLIPQLVAAGSARVVNLSSDGHVISDIDYGDPNWRSRDYDKFAAYGASKTANVLHAVELDNRLKDQGVRAFAVHPGVVATSLARHMRRADFAALSSLSDGDRIDVTTQIDTVDVGASTQVWAATSPALADLGGVYLADCAVREAADYAVDHKRANKLWALSEDLCS